MPEEGVWSQFFDPGRILRELGLSEQTESVVEFGCGYGTFTLPVARSIRGTLYAIDIDQAMIVHAREKVAKEGLQNVVFLHRDFVDDGTGLQDASVDYVMMFNILHAEERMSMLREAKRILRPNGRLAVMHWNYDPSTPRGPSMAIRPRPEECRKWIELSGFTIDPKGRIELPPYHYGFVAAVGDS